MTELNTIYNEDCLEGMKGIPDKSVAHADELEERVTRAGWGGRPEISRVWIVDSKTDSNVSTKAGSAVGRGLVGGAMFGVPGALIGAGSAKKNVTQGDTWVTFLVEWGDGNNYRKVFPLWWEWF